MRRFSDSMTVVLLAVLVALFFNAWGYGAEPPVAKVHAPPVAKVEIVLMEKTTSPKGVVTYRPFMPGTTQATIAPNVVQSSITKVETVQSGGLTYTLAPGAGSYGTTSGCAGGNCAAPQRTGLFGRWR